MTALALRPSRPEDAAFMLRLHQLGGQPQVAAMGQHGSTHTMQTKCRLDAADPLSRVVQVDGLDVGCFRMHEAGDGVWLDMLFLLPAWQRRGLGRALVQRVKDRAGTLGLPARLFVARGSPAIGFYEHLGFVVYGEHDALTLAMQWSA